MRRTLYAALALLAAALLVAVPAVDAKPKKNQKKTELTLEVEFGMPPTGKAKTVAPCKGGRKVLLYETTFGEDGGSSKIARTKTEANGRYTFADVWPNPENEYEAVIFKKRQNDTTCLGDNSPRVAVEPPMELP